MAGIEDAQSICISTHHVCWQVKQGKRTLPVCMFLLCFSSTGLASQYPLQARICLRFGTGLFPLKWELKKYMHLEI